MAADVIRLVEGDEKPVIVVTLTDDLTGSPIDLSLSTTVVTIKFRESGTTGQIQFNFAGGVLDVDPGMYEGEIVINFNGEVQTVYDTLRFTVRESF